MNLNKGPWEKPERECPVPEIKIFVLRVYLGRINNVVNSSRLSCFYCLPIFPHLFEMHGDDS
jgi:hypothetical protein